jgi:hypothetical protein
MAYFIFLIVNIILFLRPPEIMPELEKVPLYFYAILACLIASVPKLLGLAVVPSSPLRHPVTLCVLTLGIFVILSHMVQSDVGRMAEESFEFFKILVYFILFIALVDTPGKLRGLLTCILVCGVVTATLTLLEYHDVIEIYNLELLLDSHPDPETGVLVFFKRLMATGILHDPNEYCVYLGMLAIFALYKLTDPAGSVFRFIWVVPLGMFLYGMYLSKSRGGLLAFVVGLAVYAIYAYGAKRALRYALVIVPLLMVGYAGRQTSISLSQGTGRARVELWSDWMMEFRGNPVFGVGPKVVEQKALPKEMVWDRKQVAHNSFLQGFADLGFFGGMIFLGAFFFAFRTLAQYGFGAATITDARQARLHPFLLGAVAAYVMGMMTLSLCYVLPTYLVLALPVVYWRVTPTRVPVPVVSINGAALRQLAFASVGFLAFVYVIIRVIRV